jgi:hypothetical protein
MSAPQVIVRQSPPVARVMVEGHRVVDDYGNEVKANPWRYAALAAFGFAIGGVSQWKAQIEAEL